MKAKALITTLILGGLLLAGAAAFAADDGDRVTFDVDRGGTTEANANLGWTTHGSDTGIAVSDQGARVQHTVRADKVAARGEIVVDPVEHTLTLNRCVAAYQIETCDTAVVEIAPGQPGPAGPTWLGEALTNG